MTQERLFDNINAGLTKIIFMGQKPTRLTIAEHYKGLIPNLSSKTLYLYRGYAIPVDVCDLSENIMFLISTNETDRLTP